MFFKKSISKESFLDFCITLVDELEINMEKVIQGGYNEFFKSIEHKDKQLAAEIYESIRLKILNPEILCEDTKFKTEMIYLISSATYMAMEQAAKKINCIEKIIPEYLSHMIQHKKLDKISVRCTQYVNEFRNKKEVGILFNLNINDGKVVLDGTLENTYLASYLLTFVFNTDFRTRLTVTKI